MYQSIAYLKMVFCAYMAPDVKSRGMRYGPDSEVGQFTVKHELTMKTDGVTSDLH